MKPGLWLAEHVCSSHESLLCGATHLVVGEAGGLGHHHLLLPEGVVPGGEGQAAQGVAARAVLTDHIHDLILDALGHGHPVAPDTHIGAAINHALWGTL